MAPKLQRVVRKRPLSIEAIKETLIHENPSLADLLKRKGCQHSCMELFGQSCSLKSGFIAYRAWMLKALMFVPSIVLNPTIVLNPRIVLNPTIVLNPRIVLNPTTVLNPRIVINPTTVLNPTIVLNARIVLNPTLRLNPKLDLKFSRPKTEKVGLQYRMGKLAVLMLKRGACAKVSILLYPTYFIHFWN